MAVQHQQSIVSVISSSDQAHANKTRRALERRPLHHDRVNYVQIAVDLEAQPTAFVVISIQPHIIPTFPGCIFFGGIVEEIHYSFPLTESLLLLICERVDGVVYRFYPQLSIKTFKALRRTRYHFTANLSSPPLGVEQVIKNESTAKATLVAEQLISKIRKCVGDILAELESTKEGHNSQDSLPYYLSATVATQHSGAAQPTFSSETSYDDVRDWFSAEGSKHTLDSYESRFRAWCFHHSANSIDSIASVLPPRRAESSDGERRKLTQKQKQSEIRAQHRRRAQSCLINSIVCGLSGRPRVVYYALAVNHYLPPRRLSVAQCDRIASTVIEELYNDNLKAVDSAICARGGQLYDPVLEITEKALLPPGVVSNALKKVSTMGTTTDACTPFTSDSDHSSSTMTQPRLRTLPNSTASFEGTSGDGSGRILAAVEMLTHDQDCGSTSHGTDQPRTVAALAPWNEIAGTLETGDMNQQRSEGSMLGRDELATHLGRHRTRDEMQSRSQPPRKRPRREDYSSAADGARAEIDFNGTHPILGAELAARTHDPSIVTDEHTPSRQYVQQVGTIQQQDTMLSMNWNSQATLTTPGPSFGSGQPWPSDQLRGLQDSSSDMSIWLNDDLDFMGF